jgi:hypothetical protein
LKVGTALYYLEPGIIVPVSAAPEDMATVIDVPGDVLAAYEQKPHLDETQARVRADANVRQGPGPAYGVLGGLPSGAEVVVHRRTADGEWLEIAYGGGPGWLATSVVEEKYALGLLAVASEAELAAPPPTPAVDSTPPPVYCDIVPIRGFGQVWGQHPEVQAELGCPWQAAEQGTNAAVQSFQNGLMLWLESDTLYSSDPVYVFFSDGSYQRFPDLGPADPAKVGSTSDGFYTVGEKFSKAYWEGTGAQVKERLGYATGPATDTAGAFQQFMNGRMFWAEALDQIFVIYAYGRYENDQYIEVRHWVSFKDTF